MYPNIEPPKDSQILREFRAPPLPDKDIELTLLYLNITDTFQVKSITNTTWYKPGDWLSAEVAAKVCALPRWKVKIDSLDWINDVLGFIGKFVNIP